jgi:hypothetical protein
MTGRQQRRADPPVLRSPRPVLHRAVDHSERRQCARLPSARSTTLCDQSDLPIRARERPWRHGSAPKTRCGPPEIGHCRCVHEVLARALAQGREIIVLTRREIEGLDDTDDLVRLLKRKRAQLAVSGTIFEQ